MSQTRIARNDGCGSGGGIAPPSGVRPLAPGLRSSGAAVRVRPTDRRRPGRDHGLGLDSRAGVGRGAHVEANLAAAKKLGRVVAERAKEKGLESCGVRSRRFRVPRVVRAIADAAREAGLKL